MKKLLILLLAIVVVASANAQILKNIARSAGNQVKNSAENRASEEANKQVDKSVNKFFDNLVKEDTTKTKETKVAKPTGTTGNGGGDQPPAGVSSFMKSLGMSTEVPPHKEMFKFTAQIVSSTEGTDPKGKKTETVESTISLDEKTSDAMFRTKSQGNASSFIMDMENSCMIILNEAEGQKSGLISKIDLNQKGGNAPESKEETKVEDECKLTKTGKTKTISGFNCTEYRCETATEISVTWTTKDFSAKNNKIFGNSTPGVTYKVDGMDGMIIQTEFYSKSDKSSSIMTIKSIDMNKSSSFSLAGYQLSAFNFGGNKK
jgi:hypothetical protein